MRWLRFSFVLLIATLLNTGGILDFIAFPPLNIKPSLLLILLIYTAVNCRISDAVIASFAIGLAADISQGPAGPYMISFGIIGSLLAQVHKAILITKMTPQAIAIFITGLLAASLAHLLIYLKGLQPQTGFFTETIGISLYSAAIGPYLLWTLSAMSKWLGIEKHSSRSWSRPERI